MPSQYLKLQEAGAFGLTSPTDQQVIAASALLDAWLKRPEGLVWAPDSIGQPCYMAALSSQFNFALQAGIAPGQNVPVTLNGPVAMLNVGDVLILDRANANLVEACTIATMVGSTGQTAITFQDVMNAHTTSSTVESGLVIEEKRQMPASRPLTMCSRTPLLRIISGVGRYAYGRRGDAANYNMEQFNLLAALSKFGGPPIWELWQQPLNNCWDATTGQVWVPAGIMLAYYSEVKLRYISGFQANAIPQMVKFACAQLMSAIANQPGLGNVKTFKAGDTSVTNFIASALSADTRAELRPYVARAYA